MAYLLVIVGFVLLLGGAEVMVRGAVGLAEKLGVSKLVIGMTVVAFGTSAPELLVSLNAALEGAAGLAIGNVVGSNIANIFLILGTAALIRPIVNEPYTLKRDGYILLAGTALFVVLALRGTLDLVGGLILLIYFAGFIFYSYWREQQDDTESFTDEIEDIGAVPHNLWVALLLLFIGFAGLFAGSEFLVDGSIQIARQFGVPEAVIGLTIIAFGTSLPELAASGVAAYRGHTDVALGNVVGSNIFNIIGIIGIVAVVTPLEVPDRVLDFDLWAMSLATLVLMIYMIGSRHTMTRAEAGIFLILYVAYIAAIGAGIDHIIPA